MVVVAVLVVLVALATVGGPALSGRAFTSMVVAGVPWFPHSPPPPPPHRRHTRCRTSRVWNDAGEVWTDDVLLNLDACAPVLTSQSQSTAVSVGEDVALEVCATGAPSPSRSQSPAPGPP